VSLCSLEPQEKWAAVAEDVHEHQGLVLDKKWVDTDRGGGRESPRDYLLILLSANIVQNAQEILTLSIEIKLTCLSNSKLAGGISNTWWIRESEGQRITCIGGRMAQCWSSLLIRLGGFRESEELQNSMKHR